MSLIHFLDKTVNIQRTQTVSGNRKNWVSTATIMMHIQNETDNEDLQFFQAYDATHRAWVDASSPIREGDRAVDSDGLRYIVANINKKEYGFAMNTHQELFLKLVND